MDRQHRRELKHDKFVDEIGTLSTRARENQRLLVFLTAGGVALAVLVYGFFFYRSSREEKAQAALGKAIETIESPLIPPAGGQPMPAAKYKTEADRASAAEKLFNEVESKFGGTDAADVAGLYLARLEGSRGDTTSARKHLQHFVDEHPRHIEADAARFSLYQLRIDAGESGQVVQELTAQIGKADASLPPDTTLILIAHAYEAQGNGDKSKETYRRIATEFPDSPYAVEAQRKVGPA